MVKAPLPRYVRLKEAADMLSVTERTVRRYISQGDIPGYHLGRWKPGKRTAIRIRVDDLEAFLHRIPTVRWDDRR